MGPHIQTARHSSEVSGLAGPDHSPAGLDMATAGGAEGLVGVVEVAVVVAEAVSKKNLRQTSDQEKRIIKKISEVISSALMKKGPLKKIYKNK